MIAIAGPNLPLDLLHATGRFAGAVEFGVEGRTPKAAQWLESKFSPWAFQVLERWAGGAFDHLSQVVFSRADDTSQRLYYYICELQRRGQISGPEPVIFDVAKIQRPTSLARMTEKTRQLAGQFGVDAAALEAAIKQGNAARRASASRPEGPVCLLEGSAPPDHRMHDCVGAAGFVPLGHTVREEWLSPGALVDEETGDPCAALARQLHAQPQGSRSFADPAALLEHKLLDTGAKAVILWRIEEDEAQVWHLPAQRRVLERMGVPHLVLTRRDWLMDDGALQEVTQFLNGVQA